MTAKKTELLELINAAGSWSAPGELAEVVKIHRVGVNKYLRELTAEGKIQCITPPRGFGTGIKNIYGKLGIAPPVAAAPEKAPASRRPPKKAEKKRRAKHKARGTRLFFKRETTYGVGKPSPRMEVLRPARIAITPLGERLITPRWALTSDGAFINLADNLEIGKSEARALVDFVRTLDASRA